MYLHVTGQGIDAVLHHVIDHAAHQCGEKDHGPDADRDGMADAWETANNLDPKDPADRNADADKDGYTNLEEYLNSLCPQISVNTIR